MLFSKFTKYRVGDYIYLNKEYYLINHIDKLLGSYNLQITNPKNIFDYNIPHTISYVDECARLATRDEIMVNEL